MYIYNVTINIEETIHTTWLEWMQKEHIPEMLATKKFSKALMTRVLVEEDMGGVTYSIQYRSYSREALDAYYKEDAEKLRSAGMKKFADKMLAFRTELQIIDEYTVNFT